MLRIRFTPADLAAVTVSHDPDPLWETVLGRHRAHAGRTPPRAGSAADPATPACARWHHHTAELVGAAVAADHAHRVRSLATRGVGGLFASFRPAMCWRSPVLEVACGPDRELPLDGRGLRLVPSYFCGPVPILLAGPVLMYPIAQEFRWARETRGRLDALLGRTRSVVLRSIQDGATTTQLARRSGTSLASVSRHTGVLREAGLVASHRDSMVVLHTVTALGRALLAREEA